MIPAARRRSGQAGQFRRRQPRCKRRSMPNRPPAKRRGLRHPLIGRSARSCSLSDSRSRRLRPEGRPAMTEPSSESLAKAADDAAGTAKPAARTTHVEHLGTGSPCTGPGLRASHGRRAVAVAALDRLAAGDDQRAARAGERGHLQQGRSPASSAPPAAARLGNRRGVVIWRIRQADGQTGFSWVIPVGAGQRVYRS